MATNVTHKSSPQEERWRLKIGSQIHGPYGIKQMRSLVMQGMLAPQSQVSPDGEESWGPAGDAPALSGFFRGPQKSGFGRRSLAPTPGSTQTKPESINFVLVLDIKADSNNDLEQAIMRLGQATYIMRNTWVLHAAYTLGSVRNALVQYMRPSDSLFIVDATHGKTAWVNLGVEVDAKIRKVWKEDD